MSTSQYNKLPQNHQAEVDRRYEQLLAEVMYEVNRGNGDVFKRRADALEASIAPGGTEYNKWKKEMSLKQILKNQEKREKEQIKRAKKMARENARRNGSTNCVVM